MWRRAFQLAAAASFALCLAVHVLWLRSHFCTEKVYWANTGGWRSVRTAAGHLEISLHVSDWSNQPVTRFHGPKYERDKVLPPFNTWLLLCSSVDDTNINWEWRGFAWYAKLNWRQGVHFSTAVAPCWFLAAATLILPLAATTRRLWWRREIGRQPTAC